MTKLGKILKERGIKQVWVAEKLEVSKQAVSSWVSGKHIPKVKYILKLSKLLDVLIEELVDED